MVEDERLLKRAACHEAGHAVAAYHLGGVIDQLTVDVTVCGGRPGSLTSLRISGQGQAGVRNKLVVLLAGAAALALLFGEAESLLGFDGDWNGMVDVYRQYEPSMRGFEELRALAKERAGALMRDHRRELEALTAALLERKTMSGPEAQAVIQAAQALTS